MVSHSGWVDLVAKITVGQKKQVRSPHHIKKPQVTPRSGISAKLPFLGLLLSLSLTSPSPMKDCRNMQGLGWTLAIATHRPGLRTGVLEPQEENCTATKLRRPLLLISSFRARMS